MCCYNATRDYLKFLSLKIQRATSKFVFNVYVLEQENRKTFLKSVLLVLLSSKWKYDICWSV